VVQLRASAADVFAAGGVTMPIRQPRSSLTLARLEYETRDHHTAAAADRFRVLDEPTPAGYQRFLASVLAFEYAVECKLVYVMDLPMRFVAASLRSGLLGQDLLALGDYGPVLSIFARPVERPRFRDALEALGWIYVMQRNTLHNGALYLALAPRLRPTLQAASRYLTCHANDVYSRWHELGAHLDAAATTTQGANEIVEAARCAFERQHAWFVETRTGR
jgi:heme oxygenase